MASDSLKSMYKIKHREENTISKRRMSRGLEQKKHRDDEVNKRRLLSDISSVLEENTDNHSPPRRSKPAAAQDKISTRLERLKQWREEKNRKKQQTKASSKPTFKVSPMKYKGEAALYRNTPKKVKPERNREVPHEPKNSATNPGRQQVKAATRDDKSAGSSATGANKKSAKLQPGKATSTTTTRRAALGQVARNNVPTHHPAPTAQTATKRQAASKPQQTATRTDLASKLTASAAAKAKSNDGLPKVFLRANSRVTRARAQVQAVDSKKPQNKQTQGNMLPPEAVLTVEQVVVVCATESDHSQSDSDSKELHLSESAVPSPMHSTPAPRRSVRAKKLEENHQTPRRMTDMSRDVTEEQLQTLSVHEPSAEINDYKGSESHPEDEGKSGSSEQKDTRTESREEMQDINILEVSNKENVACPRGQSEWLALSAETPSGNRQTSADNQAGSLSVSKRQKSRGSKRLASPTPVETISDSATAKRTKRSVTVTWPQEEADAGTGLVLKDDCDTQLPDDGTALTLSHSKPVKTAASKRRSVRIASLAFSTPPDPAAEDEHVATKYRKTPAVRRRPSAAARLAENSAMSMFDSVNDEWTSNLTGENIVDKRETSATPRPIQPTPRRLRVKLEATPDDPSTVYDVKKPVEAEATLRALQELDVQKFEGETSFIEVPLDDSPVASSVGTKSLSTPSFSATSVDDGKLEDFSRTTAVKEEDTQPFTPKSEVTTSDSYGSSKGPSKEKTEMPVTPRSSRDFDRTTDVKEEDTQPFTPRSGVTTSDSYGSPKSPSKEKTEMPVTPNSSRDFDRTSDVKEEDTQPFTPRSEVTTSDSYGSCKSPSKEKTEMPVTPRSSRSRGLSVSGLSSFKTPGQPVSASRSKAHSQRRRTERSTALKSPEEMIEILKNSPMVEMTRRKSRRLPLSAEAGTDSLSVSVDSLDISILDAAISQSEETELTPCPLPSPPLVAAVAAADEPQILEVTQSNAVASGVQHFHQLLKTERARLQKLCDDWSQVSADASPSLAEDVLGQIRSAIGKAQLLMDQRFLQFSGLVDNCQFGLGEKETTLTDLQGFWEMIYFQVEDVNQLFADLTLLQQNDWEIKQPSPAKNVLKRKAIKISKPKIKSNFAAFREEIIKRKAQAAIKVKPSAIVADHMQETTKEFDAGFFKITSPVRSSGRKSQQDTTLLSPAVATVDSGSISEEKGGPASAEGISEETKTPVNSGDKENQLASVPRSSRMSVSVKRTSYLPAVPSPLLNDITGMLSKKL